VILEFAQCSDSDSNEEIDEDEVERYIKAKLVFAKEESLVKWWKKWTVNYPCLSLLALSLLGIPASSATSERIFSATGRILEERRQNLNEDVVNDMLFLRNFKNM
jgi:hypothetical protein